jgi:type IV secretory pathway VirB3-like protein
MLQTEQRKLHTYKKKIIWKNICQAAFYFNMEFFKVLFMVQYSLLYILMMYHVWQGRTIMHADDTSILNIGQDKNELKTTSEKTGFYAIFWGK